MKRLLEKEVSEAATEKISNRNSNGSVCAQPEVTRSIMYVCGEPYGLRTGVNLFAGLSDQSEDGNLVPRHLTSEVCCVKYVQGSPS